MTNDDRIAEILGEWYLQGEQGEIPTSEDRIALHRHFEKNGWRLFDDLWIRERLSETAAARYENQVALVVSKLLLRNLTG